MVESAGESPRRHRSLSQLSKYASCSEDYRLSYVDKVPQDAPAAWLAQGTAFHVAVQGWEESGRSPLFDIGQVYVVSYDQQIEEFKAKQPDLNKWLRGPRTATADDIRARREKGITQLQNYVDYAENNNFVIAYVDDFNMAVEVDFEIEIGGVLVKGAIDQILEHPDGFEVRDLKTGNRASGMLQVALYVLVVEKIFKWPVNKASYYYAKDNKLVTMSRKELDRYDEAYLGELFRTLERGIDNQVFIPNPGGHCMLCPVKKYCREMGETPRALGEIPPF